jgi:hypothetical protein
MIGPRGAIPATIALVGVAIGLGAGGPRPEIGIAAAREVDERTAAADAALEALQGELTAAIDLGRQGAAAIVAGDRRPGEVLGDAAARISAAADPAEAAARAVAGLDAAVQARDSSSAPLPPGVAAADLGSIALQLERTVSAADEFAAMRGRAANVPVALDAALGALTDGRLDAAEEHLVAADVDHAAVAGWDVDYVALPVWVDATAATIDAVDRLLTAIRAGDQAAAERAAADFAELADDAVRADRALQITISEEGADLVSAPLARLASAKRATDDLRAAVGRIRTGGEG